MAVRIVEDYWDNYSYHEDLIRRCFQHIYHKFTLSESPDEVFNILLTEFYRIAIFQKFDPSIHPKDKQEKKFEQFIYVYINKVVRDVQSKGRLNFTRYKKVENLENITPSTYESFKKQRGISSWKNENDPIEKKKKGRWITPHIKFHKNNYVGEQSRQDEVFCAQELLVKLKSSFNETENKMLEMILEGVSKQDIINSIHCKPYHYQNFRKHLKSKYLELQN